MKSDLTRFKLFCNVMFLHSIFLKTPTHRRFAPTRLPLNRVGVPSESLSSVDPPHNDMVLRFRVSNKSEFVYRKSEQLP
jgi:hypothetical protein